MDRGRQRQALRRRQPGRSAPRSSRSPISGSTKCGGRSKPPTGRFRPGGARPPRSAPAIMRKWFDLIIANQEDLAVLMTTEQGKSLTESRGEVAYGAAFIEWFAEEAQARLRRRHPADRRRPPHRRPQGADRRDGGDHAVELPDRHDHPQGGAGPRRRLHLGDQAGQADAAVGAGAGRAGRARRHAQGRAQRAHRPRRRPTSARSCAPTRWSARSRSPARPRSASC